MARTKQARIELSADARSFGRQLSDARKQWGAFGKGLSKGFGRGIGGLAKGFGRALTTGLGVAGVAGGVDLIAEQAKATLDFERSLTRLQIQAQGTLGPIDAYRNSILRASQATGLARDQVLAAQAKFVQLTGDGKTAAASMDLFAKVAVATGASAEDIAASAAALSQNMKIDPADFEKAFSILTHEGKVGSVELRDMAGLLAQLAPQMAQFAGGTGVKGMADLGSALQLVNQGFNDAGMAATALEGLMGAVVKNSGRLKESGVEVFTKGKDGRKQLKSLQEIVDAIGASKLAKDPTLLIKALGRKEAYQAYLQLSKVKGAWQGLSSETANAKDIAEDYAKYQSSSSGQLEKAMNTLKESVAAAFTPERIHAFVSAVSAAVDVVGRLGEALSHVPGYMEYLQGEGAVAGGEREDAARALAKKSGLSLTEIAKRSEPELAHLADLYGLRDDAMFGRADFGAGAKAILARDAAADSARAKKRALAREFVAEQFRAADVAATGPTMLERDARPSAPAPVSVVVTVDKRGSLRAGIANDPRQRATVAP